jgi:hypothetical protein
MGSFTGGVIEHLEVLDSGHFRYLFYMMTTTLQTGKLGSPIGFLSITRTVPTVAHITY